MPDTWHIVTHRTGGGWDWSAGMATYRNDPYWTTARFDGIDADGKPVAKGTRIFYFPLTKSVYQGERAEAEAARFEAAKFDESMMTGEW